MFCACGFGLRLPYALGGYFVQIAVLWGHAGCLLSRVERCPLVGGSKCYRKSNQGHGFCLLYRERLPFVDSVIRGLTVADVILLS